MTQRRRIAPALLAGLAALALAGAGHAQGTTDCTPAQLTVVASCGAASAAAPAASGAKAAANAGAASAAERADTLRANELLLRGGLLASASGLAWALGIAGIVFAVRGVRQLQQDGELRFTSHWGGFGGEGGGWRVTPAIVQLGVAAVLVVAAVALAAGTVPPPPAADKPAEKK